MSFEHDRELENQPRTENGNDTDENGKVDRIRDILFGSQMRDYDERFHRLDERLTREAMEARGEVQKRLEALENLFKREVESMTNRLSVEQSERVKALEIARNLAEMVKALESRINGLGEHTDHEIHSLRGQFHERSNALSAEINEKHDQMKAGLEMVKALEARIHGLGEHTDHEIHGLREQLHERSNALSAEINEKHDQMKAGLEMVKALESRINGLGEHADHEIHGLREQLHERSNALSAEINEKHDQMKAGLEMVKALESRINGLGEHADHEIHGLREQLHERSNALSVEIREKHDQMKAGLDRETEQIRGTMTGREALAEMLSEVALRLRNGADRQAA